MPTPNNQQQSELATYLYNWTNNQTGGNYNLMSPEIGAGFNSAYVLTIDLITQDMATWVDAIGGWIGDHEGEVGQIITAHTGLVGLAAALVNEWMNNQ